MFNILEWSHAFEVFVLDTSMNGDFWIFNLYQMSIK